MELAFPILGAVFVFAVAVPLLSLLALALVRSLDHFFPKQLRPDARLACTLRLLMIVGPVIGPTLWLISATIHQSETNAPLADCAIDHLGREFCSDVAGFGLALLVVLLAGTIVRFRQHAIGADRPSKLGCPKIAQRVSLLCLGDDSLAPIEHRVRVVEHGCAPVCTRRLLRPVIEIEAAVAQQLGDEELVAVLLHELEHLRAWDPLRSFCVQVALILNPIGRCLHPEFHRYAFAVEAISDHGAVARGADPLALARCIVQLARPVADEALVSPLSGVRGIRLRVQLLLSYADNGPTQAKRAILGGPLGGLELFSLALVILPHVLSTRPLDDLHRNVELAVMLLGLS